MKKQQPRKLQISRETIVRLEDLSNAVGGAEPASKGCVLSRLCNSVDQCLT